MAIIRLGTCGAISGDASCGSVVVVSGSVMVRRCADSAGMPAGVAEGTVPAFSLREGSAAASLVATPALPFSVSNIVRPDSRLTAALSAELRAAIRGGSMLALDATADTFYASQGRSSGMLDRNAALVPALAAAGINVLQMETFHLLELGRSAGLMNSSPSIATAAAHIIVFDRRESMSVTQKDLTARETAAGRAALAALAAYPIEGDQIVEKLSSSGAGTMPTV